MDDTSLIKVREFDYLVPRVRPYTSQRGDCHEVGTQDFAALREFVLANQEGDNPLNLMRLCSPPRIGEAIQLLNYVGVIDLKDGRRIEVRPKIDLAEGATLTEDEVFSRMLRELGGDNLFNTFDATMLDTSNMPLYEVFVTLFLDETALVVKRGIRSSYIAIENEERFVRGKIDFVREAKKNPARAEVLSVVHDELMHDTPENRLVKSTLDYLSRTSRDAGTVRRARQLLVAFDGVRMSANVEGDLVRCASGRSARLYENLIPWCQIFLRHESFTMFHGASVSVALLFPMERVFEDYVGHMLSRRASRNGFIRRVRLQATGEYLFDRKVRLQPDIVCMCANGRNVVFDTKWKRISSGHDLSVADMHQMYAYGQRYRAECEDTQHVVLIFPWNKSVDPVKLERGLYADGRHVSKDGVQVDLFFFDLANARVSTEHLVWLAGELAGETVGQKLIRTQ